MRFGVLPPQPLAPQYSHPISDIDNLSDELERRSIAHAIANDIRSGDRGRVIGIYGSWGAGKSYLISEAINALLEGNDQSDVRMVVCTFVPWQYELEGDLGPGLIKALRVIEQEFRGRNPALRNTLQYKQLADNLILLMEVVLEVGIAFAPYGQAVGPAVSNTIKTLNRRLFRNRDRANKWLRESEDEIKEIKPLMTALVKAILEAAGGTRDAPAQQKRHGARAQERGDCQWKLVVFIDDLDRCSPESMVHLFEWLKVHLLVPECTYVLALDHVAAARAIVGHYKEYLGEQEDLPWGFRYLEKLVDVEYELEEAANVERMALSQVFREQAQYERVSEYIRTLTGGDFPGMSSLDDLLRLPSLRIPRTMLKIMYRFQRTLGIVLSDSATPFRNQLPASYPFWILFLVALYYRLPPGQVTEFMKGQGVIYAILAHSVIPAESKWGTGAVREFCEYASQLRPAVGVTLQLASVEALTALVSIMREGVLPVP